MHHHHPHVFKAEHARHLERRVRRFLQNPARIVRPYAKPGMKALDMGCGPGYFTLALAEAVGKNGQVVAADLQAEMLQMLKEKLSNSALAPRIRTHQTNTENTGLNEKDFDFILAFYLVHEVPDQAAFFAEMAGLLKPGGALLMAEPKGRVNKADFRASIVLAEKAGFSVVKKPFIFLSRAALLRKRAN